MPVGLEESTGAPAGTEPPDPPRATIPRSWLARLGGAPAGLVVLAALLSRLPGFVHQLFDPDEAAIATMGMVVARGGTLYRDVADRKPPIAPFLYALSFWTTGSRDLRPLHLFAALEIAAAALVLAWEVRRRAGAAAGWWAAGLLIAGAVALQAADAQAANFSHLALLPGCGAIVAARRGTLRSAALSGVLLGLAVLTRQTWIIGLVPACFAAWWHGNRQRSHALAARRARPSRRSWPPACSCRSVRSSTGRSPATARCCSTSRSRTRSRVAGAAGRVAVPARALRRLRTRAAPWVATRDELDLWLWLLTGLIAVAAGFRFFGHYWLQVLPPLCLLAAPAAVAHARAVRLVLAAGVLAPTLWFWTKAWNPRHTPTPRPSSPRCARTPRPTSGSRSGGPSPRSTGNRGALRPVPWC